MTTYSTTELYEGLQSFRAYVEANMPFKSTVYSGTLSPDTVGFNANLKALYFKVDINNAVVEDIYYKAGLALTDWIKFGSGGGTTETINLSAGLEVLRSSNAPYSLNINLLNSQGGAISLTTPLKLNFLSIANTNEKNFFSEVTFSSPLSLTIPNTQSLGITPNTQNQKMFVYVGFETTTQAKVIAVKANSRINENFITTVYDLGSSTDQNKVYAELGSFSTTGQYNLKLVGVIQLNFSSVSGWSTPDIVLPYSPELDTISEKLLSYAETGVANRRQLITGDSLKDFQKAYNDLCVQTYVEANQTKVINISSNYNLSALDLSTNQAIIFNPNSDLLEVTIPILPDARSIILKNISEFTLLIKYTITSNTYNESILTGDSKHLNFCGSDNPVTPYIKSLNLKYATLIPNYFSIYSERQTSSFNLGLGHPSGGVITPSNFVEVELSNLFITDDNSINTSKKITFKENIFITIQDSASLGFDNTGLTQQLYVYIYFSHSTESYGIAISPLVKQDVSRTHNTQALSSVTSAKGLYSSTVVNDVGLHYVGAVSYKYNTKDFKGVTYTNAFVQDEILNNLTEVPSEETYSLAQSGETIYEAFKRQNNSFTYLKSFSEKLTKLQNESLLNLTARLPTDQYGTLNLNLSSGTDSNGLPTRLGERYCIMDFMSATSVAVLPFGGIFIADIINSPVTLKYVGHLDEVILNSGKKYLIWIANSTDFSPVATTDRIRIISTYPDEELQDHFNFKTLDTSSGSYSAIAKDALLLGNTTTEFTINLPDSVEVGSKVALYFSSVNTVYDQQYIIAHPTGEPFYQTLDATITVNNGGFVLTFEYALVNNTNKYWVVTSGDYNA